MSRSKSLLALRFNIDATSSAERLGLAESTSAATPATSGVALEVPPKKLVAPPPEPVVVVILSPGTCMRW